MLNHITPREAEILSHYGLPFAVFKSLRRRYVAVRNLDADDAIQTGMVALIHAADTFDPDKRISFGHYAWVVIRRAMLKAAFRNTLIRYPRTSAGILLFSSLCKETCATQKEKASSIDVDKEECMPKLLALAEDLPTAERTLCYRAFGLHGFTKQKLSDIAREQRCTRQNISLRLKRILARLRAQLLEFSRPMRDLSEPEAGPPSLALRAHASFKR